MAHVSPDTPIEGVNASRVDHPGVNGASPASMDVQGMIERAKAIIAGRMRPEPMVTPRIVEEFLKSNVTNLEPEPAPEALRTIRDSLNLQAHHGGQVVACLETEEAGMVVLACGGDEIDALRRGLSAEEWGKVNIEFPRPPLVAKKSAS